MKHETKQNNCKFTLEDIDSVLSHKAITNLSNPNPPEFLDRNRYFMALGAKYCIEWWANISYLHIGSVFVPFFSVNVSNTWPNNSKNNLQFYNEAGGICCVLPIE